MKTVPADWGKFLSWLTNEAGLACPIRMPAGVIPKEWMAQLPGEVLIQSDELVENWFLDETWLDPETFLPEASMLLGVRLLFSIQTLIERMTQEKPCPPPEAWRKVLRRVLLTEWKDKGESWVEQNPWLATDWPKKIESDLRKRSEMN